MNAERLLVLGFVVGMVLAGLLATGSRNTLAQDSGAPSGELYVSSSATTSCNGGSACVLPNAVNPLTSGTLYIQYTGPGSSLDDPILLIVGVPNGASPVPTISSTISLNGRSSGGSAELDGRNVYGGDWHECGGVAGDVNAGNVFEELGLRHGSSWETVTNWSEATYIVTGSTPRSYNVAVYELHPTSAFNSGDNMKVRLTGLAAGDIVVAYGCEGNGQGKSSTCNSSHVVETPFNEAGDLMAPEASSVP